MSAADPPRDLSESLRLLRKLHSLVHEEVICGKKRGGCLLCGRLVECSCKLGPLMDEVESFMLKSKKRRKKGKS